MIATTTAPARAVPTAGPTAAAPPPRPSRTRRLRQALPPLALCTPFVVVFLAFLVIPVIIAVVQSMEGTHRSGLGLGPTSTTFIGLSNYGHVLSDPTFRDGLAEVAIYFLVLSPLMIGAATIIALLLDRPVSRRFRAAVRTICFLPYAMPLVIGSVLWGFLYQPQLSPFVHVLNSVGFGNVNPLDPRLVFWSITNIVTWEWTGYNVIILTTGLQAIPPELFEAARMDGASEWRIARHVKLPLLRQSIVMAAFFTLVGVLQMFAEPETLSALTSAISSHYTPNMYVYTLAFNDNEMSYASAVAVLLTVITGIVSVIALRLARRFTLEDES